MEYKNEIKKIFNKMESGILLFTGAGFSLGCKDQDNRNLPLGSELSQELWHMANLGTYEESTSLKDIFHILKKTKSKELYNFLSKRFSISESSMPDYYRNFINFPWDRIYTLNIDDFWQKGYSRFNSRLDLNVLSSTEKSPKTRGLKSQMDLIYLNGVLENSLNNIIFSEEDYGYTLNKENPYFNEFSSLFLTKMTIFIGSQLEESTIWKYISMRIPTVRKEYGQRELRPESYYVSPFLSKAKQQVLNDYNITWLKMNVEEFSTSILSELIDESNRILELRFRGASDISSKISNIMVQTKINEKMPSYNSKQLLFGNYPRWQDAVEQNLFEREIEIEVRDHLKEKIENPSLFYSDSEVIVISGTAGDGKTAAIMNLAYKVNNLGYKVAWISSEDDITHYSIKKYLTANEGVDFLIIDDGDIYNEKIFETIQELYFKRLCKMIIIIYRSGKWIGLQEKAKEYRLNIKPFFTRRLNLREINDLIKLLSSRNVLGKLIPLSNEERIDLFQSNQASDGQLIVALIETTSGQKFAQIIASEYHNLDRLSKKIYAILSITTHLRVGLNDSELALCVGEPSNEFLNSIGTLIKSNLIIKKRDFYYLRHRIIATKVLEEIVNCKNSLYYFDKIMTMSSILNKNLKIDQKKLRILRKFCLNHKRILDVSNKSDSIEYFNTLEVYLDNDYQYWLQKGSLHLEFSELNLAESFLRNSLSLNNNDYYVHVQFSYLKLKKSLEVSDSEEAISIFYEGKSKLEEIISKKGNVDPYPYHILISQGMKFLQRNVLDTNITSSIKAEFKNYIDNGEKLHPSDQAIKELKIDYYKYFLLG